MLSNLFDKYSLAARVRPSLLALLSVIVSVYVMLPSLYELVAGLFSFLVACGFITVLAHYSRYKGKKTEKRLFKKWGGKPTSILLSRTDETLDEHTKLRYYKFLSKNIDGWKAPTFNDESDDPIHSDTLYDSAVRWLIEKTRDTKTYNLLFKENISYGFRRNCMGIKLLGILLSIASIVFVVCSAYQSGDIANFDKHALKYSSALFSGVMLMWWIFVVNDSWVKDAAESYALRLLAVCEN